MKTRFRSEKDSMGTVEVPADALWGAQTERARKNFPISGRHSDPALIVAYLKIKKAAALANAETGALHGNILLLISQAVDELLDLPAEEFFSNFPVDIYQAGAGTSLNMNVNEVIANWANRKSGHPLGSYSPIHPNDHVNRSQSTNDTFPTAMRLALLDASESLLNEIRALSGSFQKKGDAWRTLAKSGRTHLQDAVPISLGAEFAAYAGALEQVGLWLETGRDPLRDLGIGGSAAGTSLTVPEDFIPKIIYELKQLTYQALRPARNLYQAMESQAPVALYSCHVRLIALELIRICNDLRLLASGPMTGLGEILLPAVQPGSSIMPGKVNPSILEMMNQVCFAVLGHDQTVALGTQAGQLELNVMMPGMAAAALEATRILTSAARVLREKCIDGIEPNLPRLKRYFESTPQVATALSPALGYDRVASLVKESLDSGESVIELVRKRKLLSEEELDRLLDVHSLLGV